MNIDALLEDYMNNPKWAGKIFMQDEKTCYMDGLIAGAKEMQKENEQLKAQIEKMKCCKNCKKYRMPVSQVALWCLKSQGINFCCENWEVAE